ncbi:MAG: substrate-binding domain-containing protein [Acidimicrobiia bacterium]|nr:substrate-binding domain-containing protein [Acidimicrobiia bacterium]
MGRRVGSVAVVLALVAAACSGSAKHHQATVKVGACPAGALAGAGSTVPDALVQRWIKDYAAHCKDASVSYKAVSAQDGVAQLTAGTAAFAAVDAPLTPDQEHAAFARDGAVLHIPWAGDAVAVDIHLAGIKSLKLTPATLAGLFSGAIARWDDVKLQADNAGTTLPSTPVHVVYRSDDDPATAALTGYMASTAPSVWTAGIGSHLAAWPTGEAVNGASAMADAIDRTDGAVGYLDTSTPGRPTFGAAQLKNAAGQFVVPEADAITAALAEATVPPDLKVLPNYVPAGGAAYPLSFPTWAVVFARLPDAGQVDVLKDFLHYTLDKGQAAAGSLGYAPLPASILDKARVAVDSISAGPPATTTTTGPGAAAAAAASSTTSITGKGATGPGGSAAPQVFPVPPGGNGGSTAVGVTGGNIAVGNVSTLGGPQPNLRSGAVAGTAAFFAYQNSVGGVYGRGLSVVSADDGNDSAKNQSAYAGLIGKVFGFVGSSSPVDDGGASVLSQHGDVPDVSEAETHAHFNVANNFSVAPRAPGWALGPLYYYAQKYGADVTSHMAIFAIDTTAAKEAMAGEQAAATSLGYHFTYSQIIEPTQTNFTSDVVAMQQNGVKGLMMLSEVGTMTAMAQAMAQQNFQPVFANWGPAAYDPAFLSGTTNGASLAQALAMFGGEDKIAEVNLFLQWLHRVAPNQRPDLSAAYGWESARLFVQALGAAGPRPTQASVTAQLKAIDNFDGNGMLAPAGPASKRPPTCFVAIGVSTNHFVRNDPASGFICNQGGYYFTH